MCHLVPVEHSPRNCLNNWTIHSCEIILMKYVSLTAYILIVCYMFLGGWQTQLH